MDSFLNDAAAHLQEPPPGTLPDEVEPNPVQDFINNLLHDEYEGEKPPPLRLVTEQAFIDDAGPSVSHCLRTGAYGEDPAMAVHLPVNDPQALAEFLREVIFYAYHRGFSVGFEEGVNHAKNVAVELQEVGSGIPKDADDQRAIVTKWINDAYAAGKVVQVRDPDTNIWHDLPKLPVVLKMPENPADIRVVWESPEEATPATPPTIGEEAKALAASIAAGGPAHPDIGA